MMLSPTLAATVNTSRSPRSSVPANQCPIVQRPALVAGRNRHWRAGLGQREPIRSRAAIKRRVVGEHDEIGSVARGGHRDLRPSGGRVSVEQRACGAVDAQPRGQRASRRDFRGAYDDALADVGTDGVDIQVAHVDGARVERAVGQRPSLVAGSHGDGATRSGEAQAIGARRSGTCGIVYDHRKGSAACSGRDDLGTYRSLRRRQKHGAGAEQPDSRGEVPRLGDLADPNDDRVSGVGRERPRIGIPHRRDRPGQRFARADCALGTGCGGHEHRKGQRHPSGSQADPVQLHLDLPYARAWRARERRVGYSLKGICAMAAARRCVA